MVGSTPMIGSRLPLIIMPILSLVSRGIARERDGEILERARPSKLLLRSRMST